LVDRHFRQYLAEKIVIIVNDACDDGTASAANVNLHIDVLFDITSVDVGDNYFIYSYEYVLCSKVRACVLKFAISPLKVRDFAA
jgi:hypothetical protein